MSGLPYVGVTYGGDVDDPAALSLLGDLDEWTDAPLELRRHLDAYREALLEDAAAWSRRHDEAVEVDEMREQIEDMRSRLDIEGASLVSHDAPGSLPPVRARMRHLAREVAAIPPYLRDEFAALLADEGVCVPSGAI